jgi:hypothetical protein
MAKSITRAAFSALSPTAQGEHVRSGGIVVDAPGFGEHEPAGIINGLDRMRAGTHAQREWADRVAARWEDGGFPKMRPEPAKQDATTGGSQPVKEGGGEVLSRKEVFAHLLAGGSAAGLPAEFVADYERSKAALGWR